VVPEQKNIESVQIVFSLLLIFFFHVPLSVRLDQASLVNMICFLATLSITQLRVNMTFVPVNCLCLIYILALIASQPVGLLKNSLL